MRVMTKATGIASRENLSSMNPHTKTAGMRAIRAQINLCSFVSRESMMYDRM